MLPAAPTFNCRRDNLFLAGILRFLPLLASPSHSSCAHAQPARNLTVHLGNLHDRRNARPNQSWTVRIEIGEPICVALINGVRVCERLGRRFRSSFGHCKHGSAERVALAAVYDCCWIAQAARRSYR